ncbi:MAG: putative transmembrane protein [uncultured Rubrobacteraceae bacterium]|uniref:Putative transmembrane protein n=1 Tax=uncultured Rubrobacteraceae bacterium TaxID=349277 RepID=A0A6J4QT84_9ACTN|nr:MAG: putative transmembrane protein [uncultured Rubrobacteraceae bacterium]
MNTRYLAVALILAVLVALSATVVSAEPREKPFGKGGKGPSKFEVGLIGDIPYNAEQEIQTQNLFEELNREKLAFVAHDGDIKSGSSACLDEVYSREFDRFESSRNPLVYTPGDNEWTDCHRLPNPSPEEANPLNRLDLVRQTFFATDESLGKKTIPLARQSEEYPENARWSRGGVAFATLHVVGSNNNRPTTLANGTVVGNEEEYEARNAANLEWLAGTFDAARENGSAAVMLVIQANPFEEDTAQPSGFADFKAALEEETVAFGKPVVLVHGDTHTYRVDKPAISSGQPVPNFTRVETFGSPNVHWVRASVDTHTPEVFSFRPEIVEENPPPAP